LKNTIFILLIIFISFNVLAAPENVFNEIDKFNNLRLGNDYIVIVINQDENGMGRFAIETTGGAPFRSNDDNKALVYGRPQPWTSYTSIKIDDKIYVFGGKTERRAGREGEYGDVITAPEIRGNSIYTASMFNNVKVEQLLTFVKSSTTGLYDSVLIKYRVHNLSENNKNIGLRIMLDTMLGQNDGAPFRIGKDAVTTDKYYLDDELPIFWQAFDSISMPQVTSQGTFIGQGVTTPDKVFFADWGSLADGLWDFDFNPGEEFVRKGEYETDSAIALTWNSNILKPGHTRTYITQYGLGGITIVPGLLSLGVTSPAEVTINQDNQSFPIIAYIENTSEIEARDVKIKVNLPDTFTVDNLQKSLGDFKPGDITQVIWHVKPRSNKIPNSIKYTVKVDASNTDANQVAREVKFIGPPQLESSLSLEENLSVSRGQLVPNPFHIKAKIKNTGASSIYNVISEIFLPPGIGLANSEKAIRYLGYIEPGEEILFNWQTKALEIQGKLPVVPIAMDVKGLHGYSSHNKENIDIPELKPLMYIEKQDVNLDNNYLTVDIKAVNLYDVEKITIYLNFNPEISKAVFVSRGNIFIKDEKLLPWNDANLSQNGIVKLEEFIPDSNNSGTIASIHFKTSDLSKFNVDWEELICLDEEGNKIEVLSKKY